MPLIQRVTLVVLSQFKEGQQNLFLKVTTNIWLGYVNSACYL